ncbi:IspD/TarI family cytidylyltransferase [Amycolatopsis sp. CA-230715]|uniref:IspD/TarI family cytidylyltransferase n=1 Tax=Amycolatopsis sp. CA-230715 TaxID=2745196 RepID=UPI001C00BFCC|nr:2-C-methyl-D-erythritol 4-phosphate cytidylyltransferase [Amycolatopsis sp. CA-230715]QWF81500.1 2-C-methyl-D-erythritol 4-phosphate cytidylyltransferase [Amycolatopsis sp. CA-230715]
MTESSVVALVPTDGSEDPGVLTPVKGEPLLTRAVRGLLDSQCVDLVIVTAPARRVGAYENALPFPEGPSRKRYCLVLEDLPGVSPLRRAFDARPEESAIVLVHDAKRALTPPSLVTAVVEAVRAGARAAVPAAAVTDTVKIVEDGVLTATEDRAYLRAIQSPQGYAAEALRAVVDTPDPLAAFGDSVRLVEGHPNALEVISAFDFAVAESLLESL